jgi:hypothetical protein
MKGKPVHQKPCDQKKYKNIEKHVSPKYYPKKKSKLNWSLKSASTESKNIEEKLIKVQNTKQTLMDSAIAVSNVNGFKKGYKLEDAYFTNNEMKWEVLEGSESKFFWGLRGGGGGQIQI